MGNQQQKSESDLPNFLSSSDDNCCPKLTLKQRAIGWFVCSLAGWGLSIMSTILLFTSNDIAFFAVCYTIGQILNIGASIFLSTPKGQWKAMSNKSRRIASIIYILSIILTLVIALATQIKLLVLLFLFIQIGAYYWYTISFIPFGQKLAKGAFKSCCT